MKRYRIFHIFTLIFSISISFGLTAQVSLSETSFNYGKKLYEEKFYDLSILQFQEFINQYPTSPEAGDALFLLGESEFRLNQYGTAQKTYLKLVLQFPTHSECPKSQYRIAQCFEQLGQIESAITAFERVFEYFPDHSMGHDGLLQAARLLLQIKKYDQARVILKKLWINKITYDLISRSQFLMADIDIQQSRFESALQILKPITEKGIRKDDKINALIRMADIYEKLYLLDQSLPIYDQIIHESDNDSLRQIAQFKYGLTAYRRDETTIAKQHLTVLSEKNPLFQEMSKVYLYLGFIASEENQTEAAIQYFAKAIEHASSIDEAQTCRLFLIKKMIDAKKYEDAEKQCHFIIDTESSSQDKNQIALLLLAKCHIVQLRQDKCLEIFNRFLSTYPMNEIDPYLILKAAELYLDRGLTRQGWTLLRQIWEQFPHHEVAPNAYYQYARSLRIEGDSDEALRVYHLLSEKYPGCAYADSAELMIQMAGQKVQSITDRMMKLQSLSFQIVKDPENPGKEFEYARFLVDVMHLPEQAIPYLQKTVSVDSFNASSLFYLGKAYLQISIEQKQKTTQDSAAFYFQELVKNFPDTPFAVDAAVQSERFLGLSGNTAIRQYKMLLTSVNDSNQKDKLLFALGRCYFSADSINQAASCFESCRKSSVKEIAGPSLFYMARIQSKRGNNVLADSLYRQLQDKYPSYTKNPVVLFEQAKIAQRMHRNKDAMQIYRQVITDFQYSPFADSAAYFLGNLLLKQKMFQQAADCYKDLVFLDSLRVLAHEMGLIHVHRTLCPEALSGLAKAYEGLDRYDLAKIVYYQFYDRCSKNNLFSLISDLARVAQKEKNYPEAIRYLNSLLEKSPSDSLYEWMASLYDASGDYNQAYRDYQKALSMTQNTSKKVLLNQKLILSLLRQDKIPEAESRINVFEKSFKNDDNYDLLMAEIWLEKGKAEFRQKNFRQAEDMFDRVRDKYKRTPFRAVAEMEIGRTLIITNKIDDALKILIKMLTDYKDDPIYYQVYLNLGDLYFRQQQFDNAINAFKSVLSDSEHVENQQLALRYLIRIYDSMGLSEAALALTRQYIKQFPDAEDVVLKKVQIGNFYMRLKDYYRAIDQFEKTRIIADDETEAEIQYWIGKCYAEMGQFDQAILEYLKAKYILKPTKLPWASTAMYEAAMAYLKSYKSVEAKAIFEKIVRFEGATSDLGRIAKQRIDEIDEGKYAEAQ